ncbi:MAG: outer membrane lipoprotein-sorting protein [Candidatus Muirbacterium halophilum]|nr:outer membrane lipoprotein-sorting protein [Candidatus Muirbacterium halophilum]MCK9477083.1 outer membrane lipoprotein-sorting protein [Candidatus Muirbacterium halophilum]
MKKLLLLSLFIVFITNSVFCDNQEVFDILKKVDENQIPESSSYTGKMLIYRNDKVIEKRFESKSSGKYKSFIEFTYPPRDRGTKYLRIEDNLWMYLPMAEKTVKISGHMLKQSIMGSDFSYDDETDNSKLSESYNGEIIGEEKLSDYQCIILEITAKENANPNYYSQKIWVDKNNFVIHKAELFGRSGRLLKLMNADNFKKINNRLYPLYTKMEDKIKIGSYTEVIVENIKLDIDISDNVFSLRNLEKK